MKKKDEVCHKRGNASRIFEELFRLFVNSSRNMVCDVCVWCVFIQFFNSSNLNGNMHNWFCYTELDYK